MENKEVRPSEQASDTDGNMWLPDSGSNRHIAQSRQSEIERSLRDRQLEKEVRPNKPRS